MSRKNIPTIGIILGVGERIEKIRGALTQVAFAKILGIKANALCRYEKGRVPGEDILKKIADYGNTTIERILRGEEEPSPPRLQEFAPEIYDTRPSVLNTGSVARSILLARQYQNSQHRKLSDSGEAQLISYIYEHIESEHADPGEVVIRRLADLIQRQKQEE